MNRRWVVLGQKRACHLGLSSQIAAGIRRESVPARNRVVGLAVASRYFFHRSMTAVPDELVGLARRSMLRFLGLIQVMLSTRNNPTRPRRSLSIVMFFEAMKSLAAFCFASWVS